MNLSNSSPNICIIIDIDAIVVSVTTALFVGLGTPSASRVDDMRILKAIYTKNPNMIVNISLAFGILKIVFKLPLIVYTTGINVASVIIQAFRITCCPSMIINCAATAMINPISNIIRLFLVSLGVFL